jgi:hypothetical protein
MDTIDWTMVVPAGFAIAILLVGMGMMISGILGTNDK